MIKIVRCVWLALIIGLAFIPLAVLAEPHYVNGVEGIKAATLPPPGWYGRLYGVYYSADNFKDADGNKVANNLDVKVYALVPRLIWVSPMEVLGGNFFADAILPVLKTDFSVTTPAGDLNSDKTGIGDLCVEPLGISWHGKQHDAAAAIGGYAPTGEYDKNEPASPGHDMWTLMFTGGSTYYFDADKSWSASILARYEVHTEKRDDEYTPGNDFHFEYGLAKTLNKTIDLGLAGYCYWQVTNDKDSPMGNDDKARVFAAGPEVNFFFPSQLMFLSLRAEWEFEARDNSEGMIGVMTLTKGF